MIPRLIPLYYYFLYKMCFDCIKNKYLASSRHAGRLMSHISSQIQTHSAAHSPNVFLKSYLKTIIWMVAFPRAIKNPSSAAGPYIFLYTEQ